MRDATYYAGHAETVCHWCGIDTASGYLGAIIEVGGGNLNCDACYRVGEDQAGATVETEADALAASDARNGTHGVSRTTGVCRV